MNLKKNFAKRNLRYNNPSLLFYSFNLTAILLLWSCISSEPQGIIKNKSLNNKNAIQNINEIKYINDLIKKDFFNIRLRTQKASILLKNNYPKEAIETFRDLEVSKIAESPQASLIYGYSLLELEEDERAKSFFKKVVSSSYDQDCIASAYLALGSISEGKGDLAEANRCYSFAMELIPEIEQILSESQKNLLQPHPLYQEESTISLSEREKQMMEIFNNFEKQAEK